MRLEPYRRRLDPDQTRPVAVAVSGGADSLYALRLTCDWAKLTGRPVLVLYVDHGLQAQSAAWSAFAEEAATRLGAGFASLSWDGPKPTSGVPAAARRVRHVLLAQAARDAGAAVIVTGHTADDGLENAVLGQGALTEWSPSPVWPEGRGVFLLRPLLDLRRAEIRQALTAQGASWIDDPTNDNPAQPRIAARLAIASSDTIPPFFGEGGSRSETGGASEQAVAQLAKSFTVERGALTLSRANFRDAGPAAQRRVLAAAMVSAGGGERPPRGEKLDRLLDRLNRPDPFCATLAGARLSGAETITITRDAGEAARRGLGPLRLEPGDATVWDGRYEIAGVDEVTEIRPLKGLAASLLRPERGGLRTITPAARAGLPVFVRQGRPTCPILAENPPPGLKSLIGARFLAACGVTARECEL